MTARLAHLLDWLDNRVLGHPAHWLYCWIYKHYPERADR